MKISKSSESEQSTSILIVGTFQNEADAAEAKKIIDDLTKIMKGDSKKKATGPDVTMVCYSPEMMDYLGKLNFHLDVSTFNSGALLHDRSIAVLGNKITILTKDFNFQLLLAIMLQKGAKIEICNQ